MPCSDGRDFRDREDDLKMRRILDITTRVACEYLNQLEAEGKPIPDYAKEWWEYHKKHDMNMGRR